MAEMQKAKDTTQKKAAETKKPASKVADFFKELGPKGAANREEFAKKVFDAMKGRGLTKNGRGFPINEDHIRAQLGACARRIQTTQKGQGWWGDWEVVEDDTHFAMRPKTA